MLAIFSSTMQTGITRECESKKGNGQSTMIKAAWIGGGAVVRGGVAVVGAPLVLTALGFTAGGIAPHSVAAWMMSIVYLSGWGIGVLSALQSAGAAGVGAGTFAAGAGAVGAVAAAVECSRPNAEEK